jgi:hypothetical protein
VAERAQREQQRLLQQQLLEQQHRLQEDGQQQAPSLEALAAAAAAGTEGGGKEGEGGGADDGTEDVYLILLQLLLQSDEDEDGAGGAGGAADGTPAQAGKGKGKGAGVAAALALLERRFAKINTSKALALLDERLPLGRVRPVLESVLRFKGEERRNSQIIKNLLKMEHFQVQGQLFEHQAKVRAFSGPLFLMWSGCSSCVFGFTRGADGKTRLVNRAPAPCPRSVRGARWALRAVRGAGRRASHRLSRCSGCLLIVLTSYRPPLTAAGHARAFARRWSSSPSAASAPSASASSARAPSCAAPTAEWCTTHAGATSAWSAAPRSASDRRV